ncbi:hypothetical protein K461DRAFT_308385 [Myriangium duriaei CBS 260.36]|uniref:Uncharacterized protein n=1 Tax=Myriangium duriaei CBS 260.36 TaxID=1168546 RepID=A0A9P4J164_9PEZI|nr:hypothetical protein K461DRAFT_308385 [Myriangium duriaei CBS 260.36]
MVQLPLILLGGLLLAASSFAYDVSIFTNGKKSGITIPDNEAPRLIRDFGKWTNNTFKATNNVFYHNLLHISTAQGNPDDRAKAAKHTLAWILDVLKSHNVKFDNVEETKTRASLWNTSAGKRFVA